MAIPHGDKLKLRSCSIYWPKRVAFLMPHEEKFKLRSYSIHWPEKIAVLIPYENDFWLLCPSMYCSEGVAVFIPHEDKLNLRSCSIYWPGGCQPQVKSIYMKAQSFNGVLFAKFSSSYDRDIAVATLRSANIKHDQHHIWATQDLPIPTRARKMFLLGLRWQLGEWGFVKREIEMDEHYTKMTIAGKTVVQVKVTSSNGAFLVEWANGWAAWDEFQSCAQLQQIMDRAKVVMKKQGKGTGKSKDTGATPSH